MWWQYLLFIPSVALGACKTIFTKRIKNKSDTFYSLNLNNIFVFLICFIIALIANFIMNGFVLSAPLLISFGYASATLLSQIFLLLAVGSGPVSITSLFYFCSFLIPTVVGSIMYKEALMANDYVGISLILIGLFLSAKYDTKGAKFSIKWLLFTIGGLVSSGVVGVLQKIFMKQYATNGYTLPGFITVSFGMITAISIIIVGIIILIYLIKKRKNIEVEEKDKPNFNVNPLNVIVLGVCICGVNLLNTYLSGVFPSAITFPFINGGCILATVVASSIIFKERLSWLQIVGVALGISGIIVIAVI